MTPLQKKSAARAVIVVLTVALAVALLSPAPAEGAVTGPHQPLPPGVAELASALAGQQPDPDDRNLDDTAADPAPDPADAHRRLAALSDSVADLAARADAPIRAGLRAAAAALAEAAEILTAGSDAHDTAHLSRTFDQIRLAVDALDDVRDAGDRRATRVIDRGRIGSAEVVRDLAAPLVAHATEVISDEQVSDGIARAFDAGVDALATGDAGGAIDAIGETFADVSSQLVFDIELFEQNLRGAFDGEAVGYTYAIGANGTIVAEDGVGEARTAPDTAAPQHADKQVMVASVSKPLTAILVLRLMEETGVQPGDLIAPYLPSYWTLGNGMDAITFEQLLTHTSGLKQLATTFPDGTFGNDYASLRELLAEDLSEGDGPYGYVYSNLNFALLRVLTAGLMGIDPVDHPEFESANLTASAFEIYLESVYHPLGVDTHCYATDPTPTLMYEWPLDGSAGGESSDKVLICGGVGFFISAHDLAGVLSHLRYTEDLISHAQFEVMLDGELGINAATGQHGTYHSHGGTWLAGMQSCVMMFPIPVDVAITVNSIGGNYPAPCTVARNAFDDAWIEA